MSELKEKDAIKALKDEGYTVEVTEVVKPEGTYTGLMIGEGPVRPTLYLEKFDSAKKLVEAAKAALKNDPTNEMDLNELKFFEKIKDRLFVRAVSANKTEYLVGKTYKTIEDIALVLYVSLSEEASICVNDSLKTAWGISDNELFDIAKGNETLRYDMENIADLLSSMGRPLPDDVEVPMYIVSNKNKLQGAGTFFISKEIQDGIFNKLGDYTVLPSSIHEVIVIPSGNEDVKFLAEMVRNVNSTEVKPEEVLTNSVYVYTANGIAKIA